MENGKIPNLGRVFFLLSLPEHEEIEIEMEAEVEIEADAEIANPSLANRKDLSSNSDSELRTPTHSNYSRSAHQRRLILSNSS